MIRSIHAPALFQVFDEMGKFGKIEEMNVCENIGDHLIGNVYLKFKEEDDAQKAYQAVNGRFYAGRLLCCELSPVTDFREARCRQFDEGVCSRGGHCNFMHLKKIPRKLKHKLYGRERSRSKSRDRDERSGRRDRSRSPPRGGGGGYGGAGAGPGPGGHLARDCREQRGSGRYDSRGPPPPRDDRGRDRRDDGGRREERETSEERRAKIASWNAEKEPSQD